MTAFSDIRYLSHLVGEELAASGVQLATDRDPRHREALLDELKKLPALQSVTARTTWHLRHSHPDRARTVGRKGPTIRVKSRTIAIGV